MNNLLSSLISLVSCQVIHETYLWPQQFYKVQGRTRVLSVGCRFKMMFILVVLILSCEENNWFWIYFQNITYHINDNGEVTSCLTYEAHGSFPGGVLNKDNSFLCTEEGPLTKLFEISPQNFQTSTIWVEKTKRYSLIVMSKFIYLQSENK